MDLDLRKLRYFAVVAEHLHFGRAAQQLYIAQPVLSRQIRALEHELGCELLVRTTRSVALTPAGEQLRDETRAVFTTVDSAVRRVLETDRGVKRLAVAFAPGVHVAEVVRAFSAAYPGVEVTLLASNWWEPDAPLRDGRADVGILRQPFDDTGLRTVRIGCEGKVACLPATHPLARRTSIRTADLEGVKVLDTTSRHTPAEEKFELIAAGQGIAVIPASFAELYSRSDIAFVPVTDLPPVERHVAVLTERREQRVLDFVGMAVEIMRDDRPRLAAVPD
jgi:DNA-binding transcriptional LysR family regulator